MSGYSTAAALSRTSAAWLDTASTWDKAAMQWENWGWAKNLATLGAYDAFTDDAAVATKNFEDKMSDLREEVGEYAFEAGMAQAAQKTLNDYLAEGVTGGEEFAAAARDAAEANREHEATTRASEAAIRLRRLHLRGHRPDAGAERHVPGGREIPAGGVVDFTRVGSNWVDEAEVAAKDATSIILKELQIPASEDAPGLDPVKFLQDLREGAPPEIQKVIDQMIADFQAAPITSQVGVALDPVAAGKTKTDLEGVAQDQTAAVTVDVVNNRGAKAAVDTIAADRTAEVMVDITNDKGAGSILDSLVHQRVAPIEVDITNDQGANWTLNNIARDRTAYIDIVLRGVEAARRSIGGIAPASAPGQHTTTPVQPVTNNWSVTINGANDPGHRPCPGPVHEGQRAAPVCAGDRMSRIIGGWAISMEAGIDPAAATYGDPVGGYDQGRCDADGQPGWWPLDCQLTGFSCGYGPDPGQSARGGRRRGGAGRGPVRP